MHLIICIGLFYPLAYEAHPRTHSHTHKQQLSTWAFQHWHYISTMFNSIYILHHSFNTKVSSNLHLGVSDPWHFQKTPIWPLGLLLMGKMFLKWRIIQLKIKQTNPVTTKNDTEFQKLVEPFSKNCANCMYFCFLVPSTQRETGKCITWSSSLQYTPPNKHTAHCGKYLTSVIP